MFVWEGVWTLSLLTTLLPQLDYKSKHNLWKTVFTLLYTVLCEDRKNNSIKWQKKSLLLNYGNRNWATLLVVHSCLEVNYSNWIVVINLTITDLSIKVHFWRKTTDSLAIFSEIRKLWGNPMSVCYPETAAIVSSGSQLFLSFNFHSCLLFDCGVKAKRLLWTRHIFSNHPRPIRGIRDFPIFPFTFGIDTWNVKPVFFLMVLQHVKAAFKT